MSKRRHKHNVKIVFPSTITTFSMVFGFIAIVLASTGQITKACYMIMISLIMDGLDGKVARYTNTASEFGIQYDSLADLVAFGVAPCVIYFHYYLHQQVTDQVYYLLPLMYLTCGAIRLARFNVTASVYGKNHFTGLPIPAAAFMLVASPLFFEWAITYPAFKEMGWNLYLSRENSFQFSVISIIVLSLTMISTLKFDTPVHFWFHKFPSKPLNYLVVVAFLSLNLISFAAFAMGASLYYLLSMYGRALIYQISKPQREGRRIFSRPKVVEVNHEDDEDEGPESEAAGL